MSMPANQSTIPVNTPVIAFQLSTANPLIFSQPNIAAKPIPISANGPVTAVNNSVPITAPSPTITVSILGNIFLNAEPIKSPNIPPISIPLPSSPANKF